MVRKNWFVSVLVLAALLLSACQPVMPEVQTAPAAAEEPHGLRPDAPPYAVHGPYAVGAREFEIKEGDHTVFAAVWYPALNVENAPEEITYKANDIAIVAFFLTTPPSTITTHGRAIKQASPDTAHGPYPLVILSPGLAGWRHVNSFLAEHLASYGFAVMAWDPRGETIEEFWAGAATRPLDTNLLIAYADELTAADGAMAGLIDTEHIASAGHSSGGWSALMGGGAQMDFGWCAANPDLVAENPIGNCSQFVPHRQEIADMLGLESTPEGLWPPTNDPRVDAVVAMAPDGDIWGAEYGGVTALTVPTLIMAGSKDSVNIPERAAYPIYEHLGSDKKSLVVFENADHLIFFSQCRDIPWMVDAAYWACADAVWDMDRGQDLINHFVTAFLLAELKDDADAATALAPENVTFPGIRYETTAESSTTAIAPIAEGGLNTEVVTAIETLVTETMQNNPMPGFAIGIVQDGRVVYEQGFGVAESGTDRPMTVDTLVYAASLTKQFTAAAVMQLVAQGKIDLDAPVTDYLPYFTLATDNYKKITIRHLMANTTGLTHPDFATAYDITRRETSPAALEEYVRSLATRQQETDPDDWSFIYSNDNWDILADVIAKVTGQAFEEYVKQNVFDPLGLQDSTLFLNDADPDRLTAVHYVDTNGNLITSREPLGADQVHTAPQGLITTVDEMLKWAQLNLNRGESNGHQIVPAEAYDLMWKPHTTIDWGLGGLFEQWGLGWALADEEGHPIAWWGGIDIGYNMMMFLAPEDNLAIVTVTNASVDETGWLPWYTYDIGYPVLQLMLGVESAAQ